MPPNAKDIEYDEELDDEHGTVVAIRLDDKNMCVVFDLRILDTNKLEVALSSGLKYEILSSLEHLSPRCRQVMLSAHL